MKQIPEIDALREQATLAALAGFPLLLVFAVAWLTAACLSYLVPPAIAPWVYLCLGLPAVPVAIVIERQVGYVRAPRPDPLLGLTLQLLFVQIVAFPAVLLVWDAAPHYVPVAFAAIVGAHLLPFQWLYRTRLYGFLGVAVAAGPFGLSLVFRERSVHYAGFYVAAVLLIGSVFARAHARSLWQASAEAARLANSARRSTR